MFKKSNRIKKNIFSFSDNQTNNKIEQIIALSKNKRYKSVIFSGVKIHTFPIAQEVRYSY